MPEYLYILSAEKAFSETELSSIKNDICRLFECSDISVSQGKVFTLLSPLEPADVERVAMTIGKTLGVHFKAGGKID